MRVERVALLSALLMASMGLTAAQDEKEESAAGWLRWGGIADWEYYRNDSTSQDVSTVYTSFRQRYSLLLDGVLWDPRFDRFSAELDFFRTDGNVAGKKLGFNEIGYRLQNTFFPARPFPLLLYARRATTDVTGAALADNDRETASWGAEWNLSAPGLQRLGLLFDRTQYNLVHPIVLQERHKTGSLDFVNTWGNSQVTFRYGLSDQKELVRDTEANRDDFTLTDRSSFKNGSTLLVNTFYTRSEALFSTGVRDRLTTGRLSTQYDVPWSERIRTSFSYDYNDNSGRFLDSTSHAFRTYGRFTLSEHWETNGTVRVARIDTTTSTGDTAQDQGAVQAGVRFSRAWARSRFSAAYAGGLDRSRFSTGEERKGFNHSAQVDTGVSLGSPGDLFSTLSWSRGENDTTGVGYTRDEGRASAGWGKALDDRWRVRSEVRVRNTVYDTFQFGIQRSREVGVDGALTHPVGGVTLSLSSSRGVSDFLPDPGSVSPFLPGTDLVSEAKIASIAGHWRPLPALRVLFQARNESRYFTTIGHEHIFSMHPQVQYTFNDWTFSAGYARYDRQNQTTFGSSTWLLKATRRFF